MHATATEGEGASSTGRSAMRAALAVGVTAIPLGLVILLAQVYWTGDLERGLILSAAFILALSPRGLRRAWVGPLILAAGQGLRRGLLFRDGAALEATANAQWVVFDGQGILTTGRMEVTEVVPVGDLDERKILALAAGVEMVAEDDALAEAIARSARNRGIDAASVKVARRSVGLGMTGTFQDGDLLVGTRQLILGQGISVAEADDAAAELEERGETVVFVAFQGRIQGVIGLRDDPRPGADEVAREIAALGVEPVLMSGDSPVTAAARGKSLGFEHVRAEVAPDRWVEQVRSFRETGLGVAVVVKPPRHEDVLAVADVGMTLGGVGLENEGVSVALEGEAPALVVRAVALARGAFRTIRQNLLIAAVVAVITPGVASVLLNLLPSVAIVPVTTAAVAAFVPALLCWAVVASPRGPNVP